MKRFCVLVTISLAAAALGSCQQPQGQEFLTADQYRDRIAAMYAMRAVGEEFVVMFDEEKLNRKRMQELSALLVKQTRELPSHFRSRNARNSNIIDRTRPEAWSRPDEFSAAFSELHAKSARLKQVIDATADDDLHSVWPVLVSAGNACTSCHTRFRVGGDPPHD